MGTCCCVAEIGKILAFQAVEAGLHVHQAAADVIHAALELGDLLFLGAQGYFNLAEIGIKRAKMVVSDWSTRSKR